MAAIHLHSLSELMQSPEFKEQVQKRKEEERKREEFDHFVNTAPVRDLGEKAKTYFERIHEATGGTFKFDVNLSVRCEGPFNYVVEGRRRGFFPVGWYVEDPKNLGLSEMLYESSQIEVEMWRRVSSGSEKFRRPIELMDGKYTATSAVLNRTFSKYGLQRDFVSTFNEMPHHIESAFNHIFPKIPFKVVGMPYPHPEPKGTY